MKTRLTLVFALAGTAFGGHVAAQTCASPLTISPGISEQGNTCTASNSLPAYGGTGSPQKEIIYSFVNNGNLPPNFSIILTQNGGFVGTSAMMLLLPACNASTDPIAFGTIGAPLATAGLLAPGQTYYLIVTADPGGPAAGCGEFIVFPTWPVTLQKFSID